MQKNEFTLNELRLENGYTIRNSRKQKDSFIEYICSKINTRIKVDPFFFWLKGKNIIIGDFDNAKYIITAHYDTPRRSIINKRFVKNAYLNFELSHKFLQLLLFVVLIIYLFELTISLLLNPIIFTILLILVIVLFFILYGIVNESNDVDNTSGVLAVLNYMQSNTNSSVCCVLFDLEELGMLGSKKFAKKYKKKLRDKYIINCDCVANGDTFLIWDKNFGVYSSEKYDLVPKGKYVATDLINFKKGVSILKCTKSKEEYKKCKYQYNDIHTNKDKITDENKYMEDIQECKEIIKEIIQNHN